MARFSAASMSGAEDKKFQDRYNYLLGLLDTGYISEKLIDGKKSLVVISPDVGLLIKYGDKVMASIDPLTGEFIVEGLSVAIKQITDILGELNLDFGDLAFMDTVSTSELDNTILSSGKIAASLLTASNILEGVFKDEEDTLSISLYDGTFSLADGDMTWDGTDLIINAILNTEQLFLNSGEDLYAALSTNSLTAEAILSLVDAEAFVVMDDAGQPRLTVSDANTDKTELASTTGDHAIGADGTGPYYIVSGVKTYLS